MATLIIYLVSVLLRLTPPDVSTNWRPIKTIQEFMDPSMFHADFNHLQWEAMNILYQASPGFTCASRAHGANCKLYLRKNLDFTHSLLMLLMTAWDVSTNPGPNWKYTCGHGTKPVRKNQRGIACDSCDTWYHTDCIGMDLPTYRNIVNLDWYCNFCMLPPFSDSFFNVTNDSNDSLNFSINDHGNMPSSTSCP